MTAVRVGGVELNLRGGWLSFALIWTQAQGVGGYYWKAVGRVGWQRRGNLPSTITMAALLPSAVSLTPFMLPLLQSTSHTSTGFNCFDLLTVL